MTGRTVTILRTWVLIILVLLVWGVGSAVLPFLLWGIPVGLFGWWLWWETLENGWGPGSGPSVSDREMWRDEPSSRNPHGQHH